MNEFDKTCVARLESALVSDDPFGSAYMVAVELRDAGLSQAQLLGIFDTVRANHHNDSNERRYDAVLDVMDFIVGFCAAGRELYPPLSEAK